MSLETQRITEAHAQEGGLKAPGLGGHSCDLAIVPCCSLGHLTHPRSQACYCVFIVVFIPPSIYIYGKKKFFSNYERV